MADQRRRRTVRQDRVPAGSEIPYWPPPPSWTTSTPGWTGGADQLDAKLAAGQAEGAEADAADAIDFASWTVDNARLAVLDVIDARVYADELATTAGS
jgi:hypothetical protein